MTSRGRVVVFLSFLIGAAAAGAQPVAVEQPAVAPAATPDPVMARVGQREIRRSEYDAMLGMLDEAAKRFYQVERSPLQLLEEMATRVRIAAEAERLGLDRDPTIAARIELDRRELLFDGYISKVIGPAIVPDAAVRARYEERRADLESPARVHVRRLVVTSSPEKPVANRAKDDARTPEEARKKIDFLRQRLDDGASFVDLVIDYSEAGDALEGGDVGWFELDRIEGEMGEVLRALPAGATSQVLEGGGDGFYMVHVEERQDARALPFEDVAEQLRKEMLAEPEMEEKVVSALRDVSNRLEREAPVEVLPEEP